MRHDRPDADIKARLRAIAPLRQSISIQPQITCKLCGGACVLFDRVDFNKFCTPHDYYQFGLAGIPVDYWRCEKCGFLFTDFFDAWSQADFRDFIYNDDYGEVDAEYANIRPAQMATEFAMRLRGAEHARILDYGSGSGLFVNFMRDHGFPDTLGYDPFSSPVRPVGRFDLIICCEVVEHAVDPHSLLEDVMSFLQPDGCILFTQTLQPESILLVRGSWRYLAPRNGHVSTYTERALEILAQTKELLFYRGDSIHAFSGPRRSSHADVALASIEPGAAARSRYEGHKALGMDPTVVMMVERLSHFRRKVAPPRSMRERMLRMIYSPIAQRLRADR